MGVWRLELETQQWSANMSTPSEFTGPHALDVSKYAVFVLQFREDYIDGFLTPLNLKLHH